MANIIEVKQLGKDYATAAGTFVALKSVNLSIAQGEFVAIMGPSGSGKSTFMNVLGCLDHPTRGEYRLAGENVAALSPDALAHLRNRVIGFVFQGFNLLPRLNARDNVALPLLYRGTDGSERRQRAEAMLEKVGLAKFGERRPNELSGGQQQRVAIARALANEPQLILADEPTGNLDSHTSEEIMALFTELNASGITVVLVTHEPDIAHYAKRLVRFKDGEIVHDGRPEEITA
ncbi:ABC transporter ATP-binding protein [Sulfuriferula thiophila]|uniref:ABC transporter ATP-binding protein n=1 Tax=Sulfuriferula thiophila TaxID=1781211 RepID=UPI000F605FC3|nr:ABC transporter ATP-binding protein [Sulfuriferula thiophila]